MHSDAKMRRHVLQALANGFRVGSAVNEHQGLGRLFHLPNEAPERGVSPRGQGLFDRPDLVLRFRRLGFNGQFCLARGDRHHRLTTTWGKPLGHIGRVADGRREPNALHTVAAHVVQTREPDGELPTTFTRRKVVNFVHHDGFDAAQEST